MAAMLHDIGKLIMATQLPENLAAALALADSEDVPLYEAENRLNGDLARGDRGLPIGAVGLAVSDCGGGRQSPPTDAGSAAIRLRSL